MTQRTRTRNAGAIDSNIAESVPFPIVPAWVSGRFYSAAIQTSASGLTTLALGTTAYLVPVVIPHPLTATSIGIEVTTAGGAGSLARLAIYDDDESHPNNLILDAGTVVVDGTGYRSAVISQVLHAGVYWLALANKTVTSGASVRCYQAASMHAITAAAVVAVTGTSVGYYQIGNNPATAGIVDVGWMRKIYRSDSGSTSLLGAAGSPRIMLGV